MYCDDSPITQAMQHHYDEAAVQQQQAQQAPQIPPIRS